MSSQANDSKSESELCLTGTECAADRTEYNKW